MLVLFKPCVFSLPFQVRKAAFSLVDEHSLEYLSDKRFAQCVTQLENYFDTEEVTEKCIETALNLNYM